MTPETKSELTFYTHFTWWPIEEERKFHLVYVFASRDANPFVTMSWIKSPNLVGSFLISTVCKYHSIAKRFEIHGLKDQWDTFSRNSYMLDSSSSNPAQRGLVCCAADPEGLEVELIRLKPIGPGRLHIITGKKRLREAKGPDSPEDKLPFG